MLWPVCPPMQQVSCLSSHPCLIVGNRAEGSPAQAESSCLDWAPVADQVPYKLAVQCGEEVILKKVMKENGF